MPRIEEVDELHVPQSQTQGTQAAPVPAHATGHPFRNAKDTAYMPPSTKNVGAQDKAPSVPYKCADHAYRTLSLIHDPAIAASVFQQSIEAPMTITQRKLLSLSPEVCSQVRDTTMMCHIPNKENISTQNFYEDQEDRDFDSQNKISPVTTFTVSNGYNRPLLKEALIVEDEIEAYYCSLSSGEDLNLNHLIVTGKSHSIHSLSALINNSHKVECILDPGCQIIAMSETICHNLGLAYDPSIILHMQSANGPLDQLLSLSHNFPFQIGTITMYLQVHVINSPAYDVLLG